MNADFIACLDACVLCPPALADPQGTGHLFRWPEITEWMIDHIQWQEKTLAPRLEKIGKELKAGVHEKAIVHGAHEHG